MFKYYFVNIFQQKEIKLNLTPIQYTANNATSEAVKLYLNNPNVDVNIQDNFGIYNKKGATSC